MSAVAPLFLESESARLIEGDHPLLLLQSAVTVVRDDKPNADALERFILSALDDSSDELAVLFVTSSLQRTYADRVRPWSRLLHWLQGSMRLGKSIESLTQSLEKSLEMPVVSLLSEASAESISHVLGEYMNGLVPLSQGLNGPFCLVIPKRLDTQIGDHAKAVWETVLSDLDAVLAADSTATTPAPIATTPASVAATRRDELLAQEQLLTPREVAQLGRGGVVQSNPSEYASRLRREGRLLGARFRGEYRHPAFQFSLDMGEVNPKVAELLKVLPVDEAGWRAVFWCYHPSKHLEGRTPASVFQEAPDRVIAAAEKDFRRGDDEW